MLKKRSMPQIGLCFRAAMVMALHVMNSVFIKIPGFLMRTATILALALLLVHHAEAAGVTSAKSPNGAYWWYTRGILNRSASADDYAVFNQGQLKQMVKGAAMELNDNISGGAGDALNDLVTSWNTPSAITDDYAAVNLGQLKYVTSLVYDRLIAAGFADGYPWQNSPNPADDYALANIGQLKNLYNFDVAHPKFVASSSFSSQLLVNPVTATSYQQWLNQFPTLSQTGYLDNQSGDGKANLMKYFFGLNPTQFANAPVTSAVQVTYNGLTYLSLQVNVPNTARNDIVCTVEVTTNLFTWNTLIDPITYYSEPPQPGLPASYRRVNILNSTPGIPPGFTSFRLRISATENINDADGDGMPNAYEVAMGLHPSFSEGTSDQDLDGVINREDARPNNASIGRLTASITQPVNGNTYP